MRSIVIGILFCIALAAVPFCADKFGGAHLDFSAPLAAAFGGIAALVLAAMPIRLLRGTSPNAIMQVGLLATLIQMSILLICAAMVMLGHMPVGPSFIYWLMGVYVITMAAVVAAITGTIRQNTPGTTNAS